MRWWETVGFRRASGGAGGPVRSGVPTLIEVAGTAGSVVGMSSGSVGSNSGGLVEVVGEGFLGEVVYLPTAGPHGELSLGWSPGGADQGRGGGLADVGEDSGDGLGVGEGPERSGDRQGHASIRVGSTLYTREGWDARVLR